MKNSLKKFIEKTKSLLNHVEDGYLFKYGKRIWQVLAIGAVACLTYAIVLYSWNRLPSYRDDVKISKLELAKNTIDRDFDESNDQEVNTLADYNQSLQSLKKMMPKSEWVMLGDSVEVTRYIEVDRYYEYYGEGYNYTERVPVQVKEYQENQEAIPNILKYIFEYKGIDSLEFQSKIDVINLIKEFMVYTNTKEATKFLIYNFSPIVKNSNKLQNKNIKEAASIFSKIELKQPKFLDVNENEDDWVKFSKYIEIFKRDSISDERMELVINTIDEFKKIKTLKEKNTKHSIIRNILRFKLEDKDVKSATIDFFGSTEFKFNDKNVQEIFSKYMHLFNEKVQLAENILKNKEDEKEINRENYWEYGLISYATILSIVTILVLFSIRNIIKDRN